MTTDDKPGVGGKHSLINNVRNLRLSRGIATQHALAQQVHIADDLISRWENHHFLPSPEYAAALADFFRVTMDEIYGRRPSCRRSNCEFNHNILGLAQRRRSV
jgi:DNA-binding XRE family transcriptional regulator